jgi:TolB-like protein
MDKTRHRLQKFKIIKFEDCTKANELQNFITDAREWGDETHIGHVLEYKVSYIVERCKIIYEMISYCSTDFIEYARYDLDEDAAMALEKYGLYATSVPLIAGFTMLMQYSLTALPISWFLVTILYLLLAMKSTLLIVKKSA